jgi:hypothetical protein
MRLDQYSNRRTARPGFPTAEEIKKTTEAWKGDALTKPDVTETVAREAIKFDRPRHS